MFFKRMDVCVCVCIGGLLLEMRVVCYSLMHQHSHSFGSKSHRQLQEAHTLLGAQS